MEKELAQRESNGVSVTLLWHSVTQRLTVAVRDLHTGDAFDLDAEARNAMDVYNHPYAYAGPRPVYA
ncbi:MAG TPA: hypothetical protein VFA56_00855 [Gaiellaceae bacterium]|nr:hypothetical protein [Gaiellaceae bacterium]